MCCSAMAHSRKDESFKEHVRLKYIKELKLELNKNRIVLVGFNMSICGNLLLKSERYKMYKYKM